MAFETGSTSPNKGKITTTRPLLWDEIQKVKQVVQDHPRDRALLALGLNTGLRAKTLSELKWSDLTPEGDGFTALIRESKTGKLKRIVLNASVSADLRAWQEHCPYDYIASGQRGRLSVGSISRLVKDWAGRAGLDTNHVASHSLRKARCRALVEVYKEPLYLVMRELNHASEAQTAAYIGISTRDMQRLASHVI